MQEETGTVKFSHPASTSMVEFGRSHALHGAEHDQIPDSWEIGETSSSWKHTVFARYISKFTASNSCQHGAQRFGSAISVRLWYAFLLPYPSR